MNQPPIGLRPAEVGRLARTVLDAVNTVVVGKREALELVLAGILAGGHVLLEDLPGLGKTLTARSFAQATGLAPRASGVPPLRVVCALLVVVPLVATWLLRSADVW